MVDRAETLRRRVALYRRYLKEGTDAHLAGRYLREIISATMELDRITDEARSRADRFRLREREGRP
jgi:hypothetical protein